MTPEKNYTSTKVCPTCGTRLSESASRCLVCGRNFSEKTTASKALRAPRLPEITFSLPLLIGLILILLALGGAAIFFILRSSGQMAAPQQTATASLTPTMLVSPTPTQTPLPEPTATPLPPIDYTVKAGDNCGLIAVIHNVTIKSIADINNLAADCGILSVGQKLLIPQPTPTAVPLATQTKSVAQATDSACQKIAYRVGENDTLSGIAANYNVSVESLRTYNGLTSNNIFAGQNLTIPLCERLPTPGPTPTPTLPPPYTAANLLLPADGTIFSGTNDTISLQWAAIGGMREGEQYAVTIEDLSSGEGKKLVDYTADTKYIVPISFRPAETSTHIIRWWIQPVRQQGTTESGDQIWVPAGAASTPRVFGWSGIGSAATPKP